MTSYAGVHHDVEAPIAADNHGVLFLNSAVRSEDVTDGTSNTLFVGEKLNDGLDLGWASGTRSSLRNTGLNVNRTPGPGFGKPGTGSLTPAEDRDLAKMGIARVRGRVRQPAPGRKQLPLRRRLGAVPQVERQHQGLPASGQPGRWRGHRRGPVLRRTKVGQPFQADVRLESLTCGGDHAIWSRRTMRPNRAFTLIELLVVMAIIAILILCLLPRCIGAARPPRAGPRASTTSSKSTWPSRATIRLTTRFPRDATTW